MKTPKPIKGIKRKGKVDLTWPARFARAIVAGGFSWDDKQAALGWMSCAVGETLFASQTVNEAVKGAYTDGKYAFRVGLRLNRPGKDYFDPSTPESKLHQLGLDFNRLVNGNDVPGAVKCFMDIDSLVKKTDPCDVNYEPPTGD